MDQEDDGAKDTAENRMSADEYLALSDQKAGDWRSISEVNPTLFGVAGAIFAAGITSNSALVLAISPLPLYLGVWHMVRHARLQIQMITYFSVFAPKKITWEHDVANVRPRYWKLVDKGRGTTFRLVDRLCRQRLEMLFRTSAWNTWFWMTTAITTSILVIIWFGGFHDRGAGSCAIGLLLIGGFPIFTAQSRRIHEDRDTWTDLWDGYRDEHQNGS